MSPARRADVGFQLRHTSLGEHIQIRPYGPRNTSSAQFIRAEIPLRPRVVMAQFAYTF
jgi:hypothetical protein